MHIICTCSPMNRSRRSRFLFDFHVALLLTTFSYGGHLYKPPLLLGWWGGGLLLDICISDSSFMSTSHLHDRELTCTNRLQPRCYFIIDHFRLKIKIPTCLRDRGDNEPNTAGSAMNNTFLMFYSPKPRS